MGKYKRGEPVWVRMEGYPFWPGYIADREDITLDPDEPEPEVGPNEMLVKFFNDSGRFAPVLHKDMRPFLSRRYEQINRNYNGIYAEDLQKAVEMARTYSAERGWTTQHQEDAKKQRKRKKRMREEESGERSTGEAAKSTVSTVSKKPKHQLYQSMTRREMLSIIEARDIELHSIERLMGHEQDLAADSKRKGYEMLSKEELIVISNARDVELRGCRRLLDGRDEKSQSS